MNQPRHILYFIYSDGFFGAERVVLDEINHLDLSKFKVTLLTSPQQKNSFQRRLSRDIDIFSISLRRGVVAPLIDIKGIHKLIKILRQLRPDIAALHNYDAALLGGLAILFTSIPKVIIVEHNNLANPEKIKIHKERKRMRLLIGSLIYRFLRRIIDIKVSCYIAVSSSVKRYLEEGIGIDKGKIICLNNGILLLPYGYKSADCLYAELGLDKETLLVATIARIIDQKGYPYLIKAIPSVLQKISKVLFLIIGDGPEQPYIEELVKRFELEDHVRFLGYREDIPEILKNIDLFVLPSLWEGLPLTILEAMSVGVPVIGSRVDGVEEVVDDGFDGYLVEPRDVNLLSKRMIELLSDPRLRERFSIRGREKVSNKFNLMKRISQLEEIYLGI